MYISIVINETAQCIYKIQRPISIMYIHDIGGIAHAQCFFAMRDERSAMAATLLCAASSHHRLLLGVLLALAWLYFAASQLQPTCHFDESAPSPANSCKSCCRLTPTYSVAALAGGPFALRISPGQPSILHVGGWLLGRELRAILIELQIQYVRKRAHAKYKSEPCVRSVAALCL